MHRFYAPNLSATGATELPADEARHLARVLRLRAGDTVAVFDGRGREVIARVESATATRVSVRSVEPRAAVPEPKVAITLAQALLKSDRMDRVVRDAVMLGVAAIRPFASRRSDVPLKAMAEGGRQHRWERTVVASVKQCGRAVVPPVHLASEFQDVLKGPPGGTRLMFVEPGAGVEPAALTTLEGAPPPSDAIVLIGPEGGWDPGEVRDARAAGVTLLSFGSRVLRADAAAASVMSVLRYIWRDF